jgi:uncharacterized damage-inducible protein DinB
MGPTIDPLRLLGFDRWANRTLLERIPARETEALRLWDHVLGAQELWRRRVEGGASGGTDLWPAFAPEERAERQTALQDAWRELLWRFAESNPAIGYRTSEGERYETSFLDLFAHVMHHGTHHRGQIVACLRRAGIEPPWLDYVAFVRQSPGL